MLHLSDNAFVHLYSLVLPPLQSRHRRPTIHLHRLCRNKTHLELGVETGGLVRALGDLVGLGLLSGRANHLFSSASGVSGDGVDEIVVAWMEAREQ